MKKMNFENKWTIFIMLIFFVFISNSCKEDEEDPDPNVKNVKLSENASLGSILVDEEGLSLYFFSNDADGNSACTGGCLDAWPIFHQDNINSGSGLNDDDFGTITRSDGQKQTTYKGWPLYYFANDNAAGDTNGEGINNIWFVAKPDYTLMIANQPLEAGGDRQKYLVDATGNTLYLFSNDDENVSNCTGGCIQNWPAFFNDSELVLPSTMMPDDMDTIDRPDNGQQFAYQGMPLYYFVNDNVRGDTNGQGINDVWFVVAP